MTTAPFIISFSWLFVVIASLFHACIVYISASLGARGFCNIVFFSSVAFFFPWKWRILIYRSDNPGRRLVYFSISKCKTVSICWNKSWIINKIHYNVSAIVLSSQFHSVQKITIWSLLWIMIPKWNVYHRKSISGNEHIRTLQQTILLTSKCYKILL